MHGLDRGEPPGEVPDHLGADAADRGGPLGGIGQDLVFSSSKPMVQDSTNF